MPSQAAQRAYYERNREKVIAAARAWRIENPVRSQQIKNESAQRLGHRERMLRHRYGMTGDEYDRMLAAQGGGCAICGGSQERALPVDHDHETGRVRGILCSSCNRMLGDAKDNISVLQAAIRYLQSGAPQGAKEA